MTAAFLLSGLIGGARAEAQDPSDGQAPAATDSSSAEQGSAAPAGAPSLFLDLDSRLWIEGTSTVRDFTCEAGVVAATFRTNPVEDPLAMSSLEEILRQASVQIPAPQLDCSNGTMNDHMWNALRAEEEPDIRFEFDRYRVLPRDGEAASVALPGELTMAGVTRPVTVAGQATPEEDGSLRVVGSSELDMTEWNVRPPSLMFGVMRVGEVVEVHFDLIVRGEEAASD
ncbi:MAG: YceI family protein [Gemmatimonadota bacterium]